MKYENIKIQSFHSNYQQHVDAMEALISRKDIEIRDIMTAAATDSAFGYSYIIYTIVYREVGN